MITYLTKIRQVELQDVVVKATKVKMVVRGDTVVFNADAFNLSEGSMHDKLVEMLPGMKCGRLWQHERHFRRLLLRLQGSVEKSKRRAFPVRADTLHTGGHQCKRQRQE